MAALTERMMPEKPRNPLAGLERRLGYKFRSRDLLANALVHRSFRFENQDVDWDNQRLEFLGDAVLGLIAAARVYMSSPGDEGELTALRSQFASGRALAQVAAVIGIGTELKVGKGEERSGGRKRPSNLADAFEAVIGAAYLDGGLKAAEQVFDKAFGRRGKRPAASPADENPKGRLQTFSQQRWGCAPAYRIVAEDGPSHCRTFTAEVLLDGAVAGRGRGKTKREAESMAAERALKSVLRSGTAAGN